jgi:putative flippase GtrA
MRKDTGTMRAETSFLSEGVSEGVRFLLVGLANTLVDAALYFSLSSGAFLLVVPRLAAKAIAYAAGVANSFYWNRRWTFRSVLPVSRTVLPFTFANLAGLVINVVLLQIGLAVFRLPEILAVAAAMGGAVVWNFLINKYLVFKPTNH